MNVTKTYVILFFVAVLMTNTLSNSNVLASSVIGTSKYVVCSVPCTRKYGEYECFHDCMSDGYSDGGCVNGQCCCKM
ncbi:LOW QUALITY PROTEIN: putative defensin-like protein 55 [Capsella rubella]|uniref:LOW QUALITY PROTEIN: putative defensin-like protein 55 n=1 Tax=Capsella rubella TaxID=81985 RepID=UPI000CD5702D|nr:LOW QUALITY PROTEIN: putative defensin-like protein 55 [Capsella rubella]